MPSYREAACSRPNDVFANLAPPVHQHRSRMGFSTSAAASYHSAYSDGAHSTGPTDRFWNTPLALVFQFPDIRCSGYAGTILGRTHPTLVWTVLPVTC
jgi:hypothetical protein